MLWSFRGCVCGKCGPVRLNGRKPNMTNVVVTHRRNVYVAENAKGATTYSSTFFPPLLPSSAPPPSPSFLFPWNPHLLPHRSPLFILAQWFFMFVCRFEKYQVCSWYLHAGIRVNGYPLRSTHPHTYNFVSKGNSITGDETIRWMIWYDAQLIFLFRIQSQDSWLIFSVCTSYFASINHRTPINRVWANTLRAVKRPIKKGFQCRMPAPRVRRLNISSLEIGLAQKRLDLIPFAFASFVERKKKSGDCWSSKGGGVVARFSFSFP